MASGSKRVVYAALAGNTLITISKFTVGLIGGSVAMLSEAAHSFADTFNQVFLLVGLNLGDKPADLQHPFGHGKERFFWTFITALTIFFVGAFFSIYEGARTIIEVLETPAMPEGSARWATLLTLGLAFLFEAVVFGIACHEIFLSARKENKSIRAFLAESEDMTIKTVLFEDSAALSGLAIAFIGIEMSALTGNRIYDGVASILIGILLIAVAILLSVESRGLLLGQSASKQKLAQIDQVIKKYPTVGRVHELLTMHMAPDRILLTAKVEFKDSLTTDDLEQEIRGLASELSGQLPELKNIYIQPDRGQHHG